jgi:glycosyltransferase involved in cell wall biosynthesis
MKVLHVLDALRPSGAEAMLRLAAEPWQRDGLTLQILSVGQEVGPYAGALRSAGYTVHHKPLRPARRCLPAYVGLLRRGNFDVVHIHVERANFVLAALAVVLARTSVIRTVHNVFDRGGTWRLERRIQRGLLRWMGVVHVAVGASVASNEVSNFKNPTRIINNTYDEEAFRPPSPTRRRDARRELGLDDADFVTAVVGNCRDAKNHRALLEALAEPTAPATVLLHAGVEREARTGERRLVDEFGLADRVRFLGNVRDVGAVLRAADCYVMPSLYEGFSIAALEAVAVGLPAVLADVPGLRDLRAHLPGAWWVEPRPQAIAAALGEVAELEPDERVQRGQDAASRVSSSFGLERHAASYLQLYRELTTDRPSRSRRDDEPCSTDPTA